jgi:hypothetical protein
MSTEDEGTHVHLTDTAIELRVGAEVRERVLWEDLVRVEVLTTDEGPYVEDMFWALLGSDGSFMIIPAELTQPTRLLERLQQLPGFDNEQVIAAAGSIEKDRFLCWERV